MKIVKFLNQGSRVYEIHVPADLVIQVGTWYEQPISGNSNYKRYYAELLICAPVGPPHILKIQNYTKEEIFKLLGWQVKD